MEVLAEGCKRPEDDNEARVESRNRETQERVTEDEGKIFHAQNKCTPLYINLSQCWSHLLRLLTQIHNTVIYVVHFGSRNFNYFASKLPKAVIS
jgi:hypothetical protein